MPGCVGVARCFWFTGVFGETKGFSKLRRIRKKDLAVERACWNRRLPEIGVFFNLGLKSDDVFGLQRTI